MQSNQQIPHANRSYILSGKPALFAGQGFTGTRSVRSGFGGLCEARTAFFEIPQPGFPPLGEREGGFLIPNRYRYVLNNPLRYNDPTGYRIRTAPGEDETYINHDALRYIGVGRMGSGTGNHWSDSFNMSMGNFHIFSASTLGLPIGTDTRTVDFGMRNGVPGYFFNYVSISSQRRIGSPGSKDFRATFEVEYVRRFIAHGQRGMPGWATDVNTGIGAFNAANGLKSELIEYAVRSNYKSARTWSEFNNLRPSQQAWRTTNTLGKTGASYLKYVKGLGYVGAGLTTYSVTNAYNIMAVQTGKFIQNRD